VLNNKKGAKLSKKKLKIEKLIHLCFHNFIFTNFYQKDEKLIIENRSKPTAVRTFQS
tara:strand:- start:63 stop:233 length:171 start_codon:yes stop_codon:yes gene_type:complete